MPLIICTRARPSDSNSFGSEYVLPVINVGFTGGGDIMLFSLDTSPTINVNFNDQSSATTLFTLNVTPEATVTVNADGSPDNFLTTNVAAEINVAFGAGA